MAPRLGFGFYRHMLDPEHYRFARQCGATHAVVHLCDYFRGVEAEGTGQPPAGGGWGVAGGSDDDWTLPALERLRDDMAGHGLTLAAIENFDPAHWHDVLLDGPRRDEQLERLAGIVRDAGRAGIETIGYNFSLSGVASRIEGRFARGKALSVGMVGVDETPIPNGTVWNMVIDAAAPPGDMAPVTAEELWRRHGVFLDALLPVAESAGVRLAAHPHDPPVPVVRGQPCLIHQPAHLRRLIERHPSPANALEFCLGTLAEMRDGDIYETTRHHAGAGDIAYVHFRNVRGTVPAYRETFVDDGDIDMHRIVAILVEAGFDGMLIPDHTPLMTCDAGWHAGMAFACGYMRALLQGAARAR